ncbi:MAG: hypothetical protein RLZZ142_1195 [Verrucomicrobiota bacterium]|jgi:hypothetical protein
MRSLFLPVCLALFAASLFATAAVPVARIEEQHRAFLKDYCVECHGEQKQKGELRLDTLSLQIDSVKTAEVWQKVLNQINSGEMPPEDSKQPISRAKAEFLEVLSSTMVTARKALSDRKGQITMRRLNRREYVNTLRELLGVEVDARDLPADGGGGGFDTVGSSLFMSSDQIEQYLTLGRKALEEHFARLTPGTQTFRKHLETEDVANRQVTARRDGLKKTYDRYLQWVAAVDEAAALPENAALTAELKAMPPVKGTPDMFYVQWARRGVAPYPKQFDFLDGDAARFAKTEFDNHHQYHSEYLDLPHRTHGAYLMTYSGHESDAITADASWPSGTYTLRVRIAAVEDAPAERRFIQVGHRGETSGEFTILGTHQISGTLAQPQVLEIPVEVGGAGRREFVVREKQSSDRAAVSAFWREVHNQTGSGPKPVIWIDWIELEGPRKALPSSGMASTHAPQKVHREPEEFANKQVGSILSMYRKNYERYQQWVAAVDEAAALPENAALTQQLRESVHVKSNPPMFYLYWDQRKASPSPKQFGFLDADAALFAKTEFEHHNRYHSDYLALPQKDTGAYLTIYNVHPLEAIPADAKWPAGNYTLRMRVAALDDAPKERRFMEVFQRGQESSDLTVLSSRQVTGTMAQPQVLEIPVSVTSTGKREFAVREKQPNSVSVAFSIWDEAVKKTGTGPKPALWIDWIELEGPMDTPEPSIPPRQMQPVLFPNSDNASERDHARAILETFALRAFRDKTPEPEFLNKLVGVFDARRLAGEPFEAAIREPLSAVLASPSFLYLAEPVPERESRPLTGQELAARLSYFLWSAPPDRPLLDLARNGSLAKPEVLRAQVDRMLQDPRGFEWVRALTRQWLDMPRLDFFQFNPKRFRTFDESTKAAAKEEVYRTVAHLVEHNRPVTELLKSDYVIINGLLANFYGIAEVEGDAFRKVPVPPDSPRGGLLGMSAILAMGSNGEVTSPVERGAWVLRKLLHDPPPPAPKGVPQLARLESKLLTSRERLMAHQEQPQCAQCHRKIDPIGFGLENFDAVGMWRTKDGYEKRGVGKKEWEIDASGAFHRGPSFENFWQMRDRIAERSEPFARGFTEALVEYALGRAVGFSDEELLNSVVQAAARDRYAIRSFVHALVQSRAFGTK